MAIVPLRDEYTDTNTAQPWLMHTPVSLNNGKAVLLTNKFDGGGDTSSVRLGLVSSADAPTGPQARVYTITETGWTRGDPTLLDIDCTTARASAATLDGNVLVQGSARVAHARTAYDDDLAFGYSVTVYSNTSIDGTAHVHVAQRIRLARPAVIQSVEFFLQNDPSNATFYNECVVSLCTSPDGNGVLARESVTVAKFNGPFSVTVVFAQAPTLAANQDYYVHWWGGGSDGVQFNAGRLASTTNDDLVGNNVGLSGGSWFRNGVQQGDGRAVVFHLNARGASHPYTEYATEDGYAVLGVHGSVITQGPATGAGSDGSWGACFSAPDAMTRIALTNRFWAWRSYPQVGLNFVDVVQVSGMTATVIATGSANTVDPYAHPNTPHQIIPISSTEAISVLSLPDGLKVLHFQISGGMVTTNAQPLPGYPPADGATLIPGLSHQAELMVQAYTGDPLKLVRIGVDWRGTQFTLDSMPVGQLTAGMKPTGYTPRSATAHVAMTAGSSALAVDGEVITARQYRDNGSDDNWVLLTQYDQSTGDIVANAWVKGDRNGATKDHLWINDLQIRWDASISRLLLAGTEIYEPGGNSNRAVQPTRLGLYRVSYVLDGALRSQRERFER